LHFGGSKIAKRPVFVVNNAVKEDHIKETEVEFTWFPGFSLSQKQKFN
jgi:hypothetical protein